MEPILPQPIIETPLPLLSAGKKRTQITKVLIARSEAKERRRKIDLRQSAKIFNPATVEKSSAFSRKSRELRHVSQVETSSCCSSVTFFNSAA